jgi:hypothetical protein
MIMPKGAFGIDGKLKGRIFTALHYIIFEN